MADYAWQYLSLVNRSIKKSCSMVLLYLTQRKGYTRRCWITSHIPTDSSARKGGGLRLRRQWCTDRCEDGVSFLIISFVIKPTCIIEEFCNPPKMGDQFTW